MEAMMNSGSITLPESTYTIKSWIESGKWNISAIENQIRKFCFENNIKINFLYQQKSGWLMRTLYFDLTGKKGNIEILGIWINNLIDGERNGERKI